MDKQPGSDGHKGITRRTMGRMVTAVGVEAGLHAVVSKFGRCEGVLEASPMLQQVPESGASREIGKGEAIVDLYYPEYTNLSDPEVKSRVDEDAGFIRDVLSGLPIVGYPKALFAAKNRYKYDLFIGIGTQGTYNPERNYVYLNMDNRDPNKLEPDSVLNRILLNHEIGAHYLSTRTNAKNLEGYIDNENAERARQAEIDLLNKIRRYDAEGYYDNANALEQLPDSAMEQKFRDKIPVTLDEIIYAANYYAARVFYNPVQFTKNNPVLIREQAEGELAGEFAGFLLTAQQLGLLAEPYDHPVLEIFKEVKNKAGV